MRSCRKEFCKLKHATETQGTGTITAGAQDPPVCGLAPRSVAVLCEEERRPQGEKAALGASKAQEKSGLLQIPAK